MAFYIHSFIVSALAGSIEIIKRKIMSLFTPQTGNEKMDKAYANLQGHVNKCKTFDDFFMHFNYIVKTDDKEVLNKWLLKVLFINMKQTPHAEHDFDRLLKLVDEEKKQELISWLKATLEKKWRMI